MPTLKFLLALSILIGMCGCQKDADFASPRLIPIKPNEHVGVAPFANTGHFEKSRITSSMTDQKIDRCIFLNERSRLKGDISRVASRGSDNRSEPGSWMYISAVGGGYSDMLGRSIVELSLHLNRKSGAYFGQLDFFQWNGDKQMYFYQGQLDPAKLTGDAVSFDLPMQKGQAMFGRDPLRLVNGESRITLSGRLKEGFVKLDIVTTAQLCKIPVYVEDNSYLKEWKPLR